MKYSTVEYSVVQCSTLAFYSTAHEQEHSHSNKLLTSMAADTRTRTRKIQYMMYFIFNGLTISAGISLDSKAT